MEKISATLVESEYDLNSAVASTNSVKLTKDIRLDNSFKMSIHTPQNNCVVDLGSHTLSYYMPQDFHTVSLADTAITFRNGTIERKYCTTQASALCAV